MARFEIPLSPTPQQFTIALAGVVYTLTVKYLNVDQGGWTVDIGDAQNNPIVTAIPLVTGADLLEQYAYLNFGGTLTVSTDNSPDAPPTFQNLGVNSHLWFTTSP